MPMQFVCQQLHGILKKLLLLHMLRVASQHGTARAPVLPPAVPAAPSLQPHHTQQSTGSL